MIAAGDSSSNPNPGLTLVTTLLITATERHNYPSTNLEHHERKKNPLHWICIQYDNMIGCIESSPLDAMCISVFLGPFHVMQWNWRQVTKNYCGQLQVPEEWTGQPGQRYRAKIQLCTEQRRCWECNPWWSLISINPCDPAHLPYRLWFP